MFRRHLVPLTYLGLASAVGHHYISVHRSVDFSRIWMLPHQSHLQTASSTWFAQGLAPAGARTFFATISCGPWWSMTYEHRPNAILASSPWEY